MEHDRSSEGEDDIFEVDQILKRRVRVGQVQYLIRWKGFGSEADSWEPEENLKECRELIREFIRNLKQLSPRVTRRRTQTPSKQNAEYTRLKRYSDTHILHLATPPPVAHSKGKLKIDEEEKQKKEKDQTETEETVEEKPPLDETRPVARHPTRIFFILAVVLMFLIILTSYFRLVE